MRDKIYIVEWRWKDLLNSEWHGEQYDTQYEAHLAISEIRCNEASYSRDRNDVLEIRLGVYQFVELDETAIHLKDYK